ncbi:hypothetical protein GOP47_0005062 [Adiantum capillus-veneris]|uniref:4-coumarate--CoA ligase n=1 Tax=Adiantum capillus-veneris TaxID=13818 RepID=A0A9D4ZL17_ADICA|nr:hypothetical protein GOP47_0005062 [Adiantum capillus-veneris]
MAHTLQVATDYCFDVAASIYSSPHPLLSIPPDLNILSFIFSITSAPTFNHRIAIADSSTAQSLTFLQLRRHIQYVARAFSFLGIRQQDVILMVLPNSTHFPVIFFAIISLGAIATCANPVSTPTEIIKQATDSNAKLLITLPTLAARLQSHVHMPMLVVDETTSSKALPASASKSESLQLSQILKQSSRHLTPSIRIQQTNPAVLLYTSGTTGASKGALISHKNLISAALQVRLAAGECYEGAGGQCFLCCVPMFHCFGMSVIMVAQLHMGNTIITMPKYSIDDMLDAIEAYQVTHLPVVPPIMVALAKHESATRSRLSSLIEVVCGAGRVSDKAMDEVLQRLQSNAYVRLDYGMTEASGRIAITACKRLTEAKVGFVGSLTSGMEALVVDPSSKKRLPPNEQGELWVRGSNVIQGYFRNEEATAATISQDGWLYTGDLVYFDNDGGLHIVGRLKDLIKCKGFQVAPTELETILLTHPAITDAAVVGFPDEYAGEIPVAFIVQAQGSLLKESDVISFVEAKVAPYKRIRQVRFVKTLPKTASGKVMRHKLMHQATSKL